MVDLRGSSLPRLRLRGAALLAAVLLAAGCPPVEPNGDDPLVLDVPPPTGAGLALDEPFLPELRAPGQPAPALVARIVGVTGDEVRLDRGADHGVRARTAFQVYRPAEVVLLPQSDQPVYRPQAVAAEVVVRFVEAQACVARLLPGGDAASVVTGALCVSQPFAREVDLPPALRASAVPLEAYAGEPTPVEVAVDDEPGGWLCFEWSASAGSLGARRTTAPRNLYYAPAAGGAATLAVTARDASGHEATLSFQVTGRPGRGMTQPGWSVDLEAAAGATWRDVAFARAPEDGGWCRLEHAALASRLVFHDPCGREVARAVAQGLDLTRVAWAEDAVYVATREGEVRRYPRTEDLAALFRSRPRAIAPPHGGRATDLALAPSGHLYVLDGSRRQVHLFDPRGAYVLSFGRPGDRPGELAAPVAIAARHDELLVLDDGRKALVRYVRARAVQDVPVGGPGDVLVGLAADPVEAVAYVLEASQGTIKRVSLAQGTLAGRIEPEAGLPRLRGARGLRLDPLRALVVLDRDGRSLARFAPDGRFLGRRGGLGLHPEVLLAAGPRGDVWLVDRAAGTVLALDPEGWARACVVAGTTPDAPSRPWDVVVDADGRGLVLDLGRGEVAALDLDGARRETIPLQGGPARGLLTTPQRAPLLVEREDGTVTDAAGLAAAGQGSPDRLRAQAACDDRGLTYEVVAGPDGAVRLVARSAAASR